VLAPAAAEAIIFGMVVQNTSRYPTEDVQRLVRFATGDLDMRGVCVNVKNSRRYPYGGYAYLGVPEISNAPASSEYLITVRLGTPDRFPFTPPRRRGSPSLQLGCWREALVAVAAHEAWHIQQYRQELPRSEVACERFEAVVIGRFRERPD
jgi:hypothetical protein